MWRQWAQTKMPLGHNRMPTTNQPTTNQSNETGGTTLRDENIIKKLLVSVMRCENICFTFLCISLFNFLVYKNNILCYIDIELCESANGMQVFDCAIKGVV